MNHGVTAWRIGGGSGLAGWQAHQQANLTTYQGCEKFRGSIYKSDNLHHAHPQPSRFPSEWLLISWVASRDLSLTRVGLGDQIETLYKISKSGKTDLCHKHQNELLKWSCVPDRLRSAPRRPFPFPSLLLLLTGREGKKRLPRQVGKSSRVK